MSSFYSRRKRSSSFGSYGAYKAIEKPVIDLKPELIEGYAHICFEDQALWFRGILLTADGQSYNLSGERIFIDEEDVKIEESETNRPDIIQDFPSPVHSTGKGPLELNSNGNSTPSRKNSIDSQSEKELQFTLDDSAKQSPDQSPLKSQSPPSTQQIISALDSLVIKSNRMSSISEQKTEEDSPVPSPVLSPVSNISPFRSRSGSSNKQNIEMISVSFDIAVSDLEEGTQHKIRHVAGRKGNTLTLRSKQLCFMTEKAYWGQRATMVIQNQLAVPELIGQKCHVYAGPMRFYLVPRPFEAKSLTSWCW